LRSYGLIRVYSFRVETSTGIIVGRDVHKKGRIKNEPCLFPQCHIIFLIQKRLIPNHTLHPNNEIFHVGV